MADHLVKQILDTVKTTLTGLTTTGSNVFRARSLSVNDSNLPAILISMGDRETDTENLAGLSGGGLGEMWEIGINVQALAKNTNSETTENTLLQISKEIEVAIFADKTLGGLAKDLRVESVAESEFDGDGEKTVAGLDIQLAVLYRIKQGIPDAAIA